MIIAMINLSLLSMIDIMINKINTMLNIVYKIWYVHEQSDRESFNQLKVSKLTSTDIKQYKNANLSVKYKFVKEPT